MRTIIPIIHGWDSCRDRRNQSSAGETREDLGGFQPVSMFLIPLSNAKKGALVGWRHPREDLCMQSNSKIRYESIMLIGRTESSV